MVDRVHRSLQRSLHGRHGAHDRRGELADPPIVRLADGHRVQEVALLATDLARRHEVRVLQDPEVLHDPEPRHLGKCRAQLTERLAIALEEPVEQDPPTRVGEGPKDGGHVIRHGT